MRHNFRKITLYTCPGCKTAVIIPKLGQNSVIVYVCPECEEIMVLFRDKLQGIDKKKVAGVDINKLQKYIVKLIERELPRQAQKNSPDLIDSPDAELDLMLFLEDIAEDLDMDGEDTGCGLIKGPITKEEISAFRKHLKFYKMPWKDTQI